MAEETLNEAIERTAKGPASTSVDGVHYEAKDVREQIAAAQHLAAQQAANKNHLGLSFVKLESPGAG